MRPVGRTWPVVGLGLWVGLCLEVVDSYRWPTNPFSLMAQIGEFLQNPVELTEFLKNVCFHREDFMTHATVKHFKSLLGCVTV